MPKLEELQKSKNIAELLDKEKLAEIAQQVFRGYEIDEDSRSEWLEIMNEALDIAKQVMEEKSFPWPGASNIKYPLVATACINYASRVMPEIIQGDRLVKSMVIGKDPEGKKYTRSNRASQCLSYQLLSSPDWEDGTDKLLQVLPLVGTVFKKTYWNVQDKRHCSELCVPDRIVVNYNTQSLETARRVTHILKYYKNDVLERIRRGSYLSSIEIDTLYNPVEMQDKDFGLDVLEQHCWLDLDDDDYKEPYVVTMDKTSKQVFSIVNRFDKIEKNKEGEVVRITADQHFTDYHFMRSPDGGFYSIGYGSHLLPINKSINSLINMLTDSGTLANIQGGFYSSRLRTKAGEMTAKMGVFQKIDVPSGGSIADCFYQHQFKEPSQTLLSLLTFLVKVGDDMSSTTDAMSGNQPAQNVASNTMSQLIDQGSKVFKAINKRVIRALQKEYQKLYVLNYYYLKQEDYQKILDDPEANVKQDFDLESMDIIPVADPAMASDQQRMQKASVIMQLQSIDRREADRFVLESLQLDSSIIDKLLPEQDPNAPPPPEVQKIQAEIQFLQAQVAKISADATLAGQKVQVEQAKAAPDMQFIEAQINESAARVWKMQQDVLTARQKNDTTSTKMQHQEQLKEVDMVAKAQKQHHDQSIKEVETAHNISKENAELILEAEKFKADKEKQENDDIAYTAKLKGIPVRKVKEKLEGKKNA